MTDWKFDNLTSECICPQGEEQLREKVQDHMELQNKYDKEKDELTRK